MTLPALTTKYQKIVVENKLKKFYSIMSQAVRIAESEYGEYPNWAPTADMEKSADKFEEWYNKYLDPQIDSQYKEKLNSIHYQVGLKDGSGFVAYIIDSRAIAIMYCTEMKYCGVEHFDGIKTFLFYFDTSQKAHNYFITQGVDSTRENLLNGCKYGNYDNPNVSSMGRRHTCAALIQKDGWKIKNDYPWKQIQIEQ